MTATAAVADNRSEVVALIMERIKAFDKAIAESNVLDIDGVCINNEPCAEVTGKSRIKVLNNALQAAFEVDIDTIIRTPLDDVLASLETGVTVHLVGVTRIVGYYSRVNNWNKSKIGELHDRHRGDYSVAVWQPMSTAPRDGTHVRLRGENGKVYENAHWAQDSSGEEQPPFAGWFEPVKGKDGHVDYMAEICAPDAWQPIAQLTPCAE